MINLYEHINSAYKLTLTYGNTYIFVSISGSGNKQLGIIIDEYTNMRIESELPTPYLCCILKIVKASEVLLS